MEQFFFSPNLHKEVFDHYKPDMLVVTSLGTLDYDQFFMREARKRKVKVISVVLSWDNTTTRGMPGAVPDHVVAWTNTMKNELIELNDIPEKKIFVGGIAHFDHYYRSDTFLDQDRFYKETGLDPQKKTLFFVTKSPNGYAWNSEIAKTILQGIKNQEFFEPVQLFVRLHPIYYCRANGRYIFQSFLDEFYQLQKEFSELILNEPIIDSEDINFLMPQKEIRLLASILKNCDVVINIFSTLNLEASIFDKPIVNICFEGDSYTGPMKARYNITLDEDQTHNQRVIKSGGIQMARNEKQMIEYINYALIDPTNGSKGRAAIRQNECGPYPGEAGKNIAKYLLSFDHPK